MDRNDFTGTVPNAIANLLDLDVLNLSFNGFRGTVPPGICEIERLRIFIADCEKVDCAVMLVLFLSMVVVVVMGKVLAQNESKSRKSALDFHLLYVPKD